MTEPGRISNARFFALLLWLCAAASAWLLFSPAAFHRRALTRRAERLEAQVIRERVHESDLERRRDALQHDPSTIEQEARRLGYGRPNERTYYLSDEEMAHAREIFALSAEPPPKPFAEIRATLAPVAMWVIVAMILILFFSGLKVPEVSVPAKGTRRSPKKR